MAKKSMIARWNKRKKISNNPEVIARRKAIKKIISSPDASSDERWNAVLQLQRRRRDESPSRLQRRCVSCGRPRAVLRRFLLCRACLRQAWMRGDVPGLVKASW